MSRILRQIMALGILLSLFGVKASAEERWIMPDSLAIATYSGIPQIQLTRDSTGFYVAKINFKASYERVARYILESAPDTLISELSFTPTDVKTILSSDSSLFLKAYSMTPSVGGLQLRAEFNSAMDEAAVLRFLRVLNIFGFADGIISCPEGSKMSVCGKKIVGLPLYNQYRDTPNARADEAARKLFLVNSRKFELLLSDPFRFKSISELEAYISAMIAKGCGILDGADESFCNILRPYSSFSEAVKALAREAFGDKAGEQLEIFILSPAQIFGNGHAGSVVTFEMRDHKFSWPGTSWSQIDPDEYPNFWTINWVDPIAPARDVTFAEDFFFSKFDGGFYFTDWINEYGFGTGGFAGWTNSSGEAFRLRGVSRGGLISGRISTRFALRDEKNWPRTYLEISQRAPGERAWTAAAIYRAPESMTNKVADGAGFFYTIENLFIPEGLEVMLRFVVPPDIQWDSRGQMFTLYLAELRGVRCPLEIYQSFRSFCK